MPILKAELPLDPQTDPFCHPRGPLQTSGFSFQQIDPVEAKCVEIKTLLQTSEPFLSNETVSHHITRHNLITCVELYGRCFQPNVPIVHTPSFNLIKTPPILLCAMMLVGACYSDSLIPLSHLTKLAMQLLVIIEQQPVWTTFAHLSTFIDSLSLA